MYEEDQVSDPEPPTGAGDGGSDDRSSRDPRTGRPTSRGRSGTPPRGEFRSRDAGDRRTGGFGKPQRGGSGRTGAFRDRDRGTSRSGGFPDRDGNAPRAGGFRHGSRDRQDDTGRDRRDPNGNRDRTPAPGGFRDRKGNGGFRARRDAGEQGGFRSRQQAGEQGSFRARRDNGEQGGFRPRQQAGEQGGFRARRDTGERGGFRTRRDAGEPGDFRPRQQAGEQGSFRARRDNGEQGSFRTRREAGDQGGFRDRREPRDPEFRDRRAGSERTGGGPPDRFRGRPDTSGSRTDFRDRRDAVDQGRDSDDRPAFRPRRDPADRPRDEKSGTRGDFRDRREPGDRSRKSFPSRGEARDRTGFRKSGERGDSFKGDRAGRPGRDQDRGGFRDPVRRGGRFQDRHDAAGHDRAASHPGERDRGEFPGGRDDRGGFRGRREGAGRDRGERAGVQGDEQRDFEPRDTGPELPEGAEYSALDAEARRELRGLPKGLAEIVGQHLVAAGMLVDEEPERALEHARYARSRAARVAIVREAAGLTAYHAGEWAEALGELRAVRRMSGGDTHLAVMADCERALGRPERALELAAEAGPDLPPATAAELRIVAAGARRDLGQLDAAVVALQGPDLDPRRRDPWSARLFYAYADNLQAAGRTEDAIRWFLNAAEADDEELTDAPERAVELGATLDVEPSGPDAAADE